MSDSIDTPLEHAWEVCRRLEKAGLALTPPQVAQIAEATHARDVQLVGKSLAHQVRLGRLQPKDRV